jgi:hypothetical protein
MSKNLPSTPTGPAASLPSHSAWHQKRFAAIESAAEAGSAILETGRWDVGGYGTVALSESIWNEVGEFPRTLAWRLHQFEFLPNLIAFDRKHNSQRGSVLLDSLINSWWSKFQASPREMSNMAWHDHGTALRLQNLLLLRSHLGSSAFLDDLCLQHGHLLMSEAFYNRGNNHGLDQCLALFECGHEMQCPDMHQVATTRILDEIGIAFAADGGHVENSPGYHHFGINQIKSANEVSLAYAGKPFKQTSLVERAEEILAHMTRPDRMLPHIGDTVDFVVRRLPQPDATDITLSDSGWSIFRSGWDAKAIHGVLKCGFLSQSHRQDDDLSFSLFGFGEEWLIDGGLFAHQPKDPMRIYMRSHEAHSLPYVVGMKASRDLVAIGQFSKITSFSSNENVYEVTAVTRMWAGFEAQRTIRFDRSDHSIAIHDRIRPLDKSGKARAARRCEKGYAVYGTRFLVPGHRSVSRSADGALIGGSKVSLQIATGLRSKLIKGQTDPAPVGWRSRKAHQTSAAHDLSFLCFTEEYDERFLLNWHVVPSTSPAQ